MKKTLVIVFAGLAALALPQAQATTLSLSAPAVVSGSFDVTVTASDIFASPHGDDAFGAFGFDVNFDPTILAYSGPATVGAQFDDISGNPGITATVAGTIQEGFLFSSDFTNPLNLTLAILHFNVIGFGPTTISITGDSTNLDQGLLYLSASENIAASTDVSAVDVTATPEPGTLLLTAIAAAGLFAGRFRR